MNKNYKLLFTLLCTLMAAGCASQYSEKTTEAEAGVLSKMSEPGIERYIEHIAGDVYRFHNNHHSSLFMPTDAGVVLVDPLNVPTAEWVKGEIETLFGKPVTHVIYSHGHQDHASGAAVYENAEIISHKNTFEVIAAKPEQPLTGRFSSYDINGDGVIDSSEVEGDFAEEFLLVDTNGSGVITGQESVAYNYRNVVPPTQTYDDGIHLVEVGGKTVELHYVGGNHASDMSYIFFPEESLVFYVDVISLGAIPFGTLPWYSLEDSKNTYEKALAINAEIAVPSHGPVGTQDDVRDLQEYMTALREGVSAGIQAGQSLEEIQTSLMLEQYSSWDYYEDRLPQNIAGMYRVLTAETE